jgi:sortase A
MRRYTAILLIVVGVFTVLYPTLKQRYFDRRQRVLLETLAQSWDVLDDGREEEASTEGETHEPSFDKYIEEYIQTHMEGLLKIDKIRMKLPILKGASKTNLNISAVSIEGTGRPGEEGNYCISAHRGRSYGWLFNRLDELEVGDLVEILQKDITYSYEVFEKLMVTAEDTWVLLPQEEEKLLTLITCDYSSKPYPRLIVRAKLLEPEEN